MKEEKNIQEEKKQTTKEKKLKKSKEIEELEREVAELTDKCARVQAELTDKCARAQAEVINFKRRKDEETSLKLKYCNEELLLKFVGICDDLERAINMDDDNLEDEVSKFLSGIKMIYANMLEILKSYEVVEITCLNKPFDANFMEAILVEHTEGKEPNTVVDVLQKGYMYKDRVLRPAMVKIND